MEDLSDPRGTVGFSSDPDRGGGNTAVQLGVATHRARADGRRHVLPKVQQLNTQQFNYSGDSSGDKLGCRWCCSKNGFTSRHTALSRCIYQRLQFRSIQAKSQCGLLPPGDAVIPELIR